MKPSLLKYIDTLPIEDRLIAKRTLDLCEQAQSAWIYKSTDFLSLHEQSLSQRIVNAFSDLKHYFSGITQYAERKVLYIYDEQVYKQDWTHESIALMYGALHDSKTPRHQDILGSLLALGIQRQKIGDIYVGDSFFCFFVKKELVSFIEAHFSKVGKSPIVLSEKPIDEGLDLRHDFKIEQYIVTSLRADTMVSTIAKKSRSKAAAIIDGGGFKLNGKVHTKKQTFLAIGDVFSIHKVGKFCFLEVVKTTKKGNQVVQVEKYL